MTGDAGSLLSAANRISPKGYHAEITASANALDPLPSAIYVNVAGTATMTDSAGTSIEYNVEVGVLPFIPTKVTALSSAELIGWYPVDPS